MKILVMNAGSSSLKFTLFDKRGGKVAAAGVVERIGLDGTVIHYRVPKGEILERSVQVSDTRQAVGVITQFLSKGSFAVIESTAQITAVGHRVVHGGEWIRDSVVIDDRIKLIIEDCARLAPLHNLPNLRGIEACEAYFPDAIQVAVFDTAFHNSLPEHAYLYALPYRFYSEDKIRRYGFHGTSHQYVSQKAAKFLGRTLSQLKIVTWHIGNGSSITAVAGGKSVDTSMGMTPLEGCIMGSRCGDIDPAIVFHIIKTKGLKPDQVLDLLNKQSGLMGLAGIGSSDFRDIERAMEAGNHQAKMALKVYAYRIKKYIGVYAFAMGGLDVVVFTAGIGENSSLLRRMVCEDLENLGIILHPGKNAAGSGKLAEIQGNSSRVKILVIPTNEEKQIALQTLALINGPTTKGSRPKTQG
jgi:acetate kinase